MQIKNWNDLRYLLAVKRGRSISAAARIIGVDDTTVSRRLAALQSDIGEPLFQRLPNGTLSLTSRGDAIAHYIEGMEHQVDAMTDALGSPPGECTGTVRMTSVPILVNRLLAPHAGLLLDHHPMLELELIPESRDMSLTRREADLALRLARPTTGGAAVKAKRIGTLDFAVYASCEAKADRSEDLPWIAYDGSMAHLPQAQWMAKVSKGKAEPVLGLKVQDAETALEAVLAGLGRTLLPTMIADRESRLVRLNSSNAPSLPSRELWLLVHTDLQALRRIRAVMDWVENLTAEGNRWLKS